MNKEILKKVRALYVEDEENVRVFTAKTLENVLQHVDTAVNGKDALEMFIEAQESSHPYNLIITDINMPKMDGLQMSKEIRKLDPNVSIIVTSAHNDADFLKKSIDVGINSYTLKPIDLYQLIEEVIKTMEPFFLREALEKAKLELIEENKNLNNDLSKNKEKIKSLLEVQDSIIFVSNGEKIEDANTKFLKFFNCETVDQFIDQYTCVYNLFVDEDGKRSDVIDYDSERSWVDQIIEISNEHIVVGLKDLENTIKFFEINISKYDLDGIHYVISFNDITQLKEKSKIYEYQNTHDVITGLYNKERIKKYITSEIKRSDRYEHNLSLVFFDFGAQPLEREDYIDFAQLLKTHTRDQDFAARLQKNQFVLLLPESDKEAAVVVREKIINEYHEKVKNQEIMIKTGLEQYIKGESQEELLEKVSNNCN